MRKTERILHSHKMLLLALSGLFTDRYVDKHTLTSETHTLQLVRPILFHIPEA